MKEEKADNFATEGNVYADADAAGVHPPAYGAEV